MNTIGTFLKLVAFDARIIAKILNLVTCVFFLRSAVKEMIFSGCRTCNLINIFF